MRLKTTAALSLLVGCGQTELPDEEWYTCEPEAQAAHPLADAAQAIVDGALRAGSPGVSVAVLTDEGRWAAAGGVADIVQDVELQTCHRFYVASVTKMFAGTVVLQLAEEGLLSLDEPANRYLPSEVVEGIANADSFTIRQLLQHTSGVPGYVNMGYMMDAFNRNLPGGDAAEEIARVYGEEALFAPGEDLVYSNTNYLLLSLIVERVTGKASYDAIRERVWEPLGMSRTMGRSEGPDALVRGYADLRGDGRMVDHTELTETVMMGEGKLDGGLVSTPSDLVVFLDTLVHGGLLSDTSFQAMTDFYPYPEDESGLEVAYGLGLALLDTPYGEAWGHYGGVYPFQSAAFYFPGHDTTVAITVNGWNAATEEWISGAAPFAPLFD